MEVHKTKQKRKRSRSPSALKKLKKEKKKKHRSHSSDNSEVSVSVKKKSSHKKKKKKDRKKKDKKHKQKVTYLDDDEGRSVVKEEKNKSKEVAVPKSSSVETHKKRSMVPMTRDEYERQQSVVKRVFDPQTGRNRLVKGDGEILEEIVSKGRHKEINKMSTMQDGRSFAASIGILK